MRKNNEDSVEYWETKYQAVLKCSVDPVWSELRQFKLYWNPEYTLNTWLTAQIRLYVVNMNCHQCGWWNFFRTNREI